LVETNKLQSIKKNTRMTNLLSVYLNRYKDNERGVASEGCKESEDEGEIRWLKLVRGRKGVIEAL
jgi:hypothetical protein